jgi:serine/threonine protein kinase
MGELTDGEPMFAGDSDLDQLARIQRMQGRLTPAQEALFLQVCRAASRLFSAAPGALTSALSQRVVHRPDGACFFWPLWSCGARWPTHTQQNPANADCAFGEKQDDLSLKYGDKVDPTSLDFMRGLLVIDPKSRLTAEDALRHPYFQSLWQD